MSKILSIGYEFEIDEVKDCKFQDNIDYSEYEIIIFNPNCLNSQFSRINEEEAYDLIKSKRALLNQANNLGTNIFIFTPLKSYNFDVSHSSNGRYWSNSAYEMLFGEYSIIEAEGEEIIAKNDTFDEFLKNVGVWLHYKGYYTKPIGKPVLFSKKAKQVVGSIEKFEDFKGYRIFIPNLKIFNPNEFPRLQERVEKNFISSIRNLSDKLNKSTDNFTLPSWSENYILPFENELTENLTSLNLQLKDLEETIQKKANELKELKDYKILFCGGDTELEVQCKKLFEELGFEVEESPQGDADLILKFEGKIFVVEVKGVSGSATKKHSRQLEEWVSNYCRVNDVEEAKGILVVNAFKDTSPNERTEKAFPDNVVEFSLSRNHCLLTGFQLLNLYFEYKDRIDKTTELPNLLYETKGLCKTHNGWEYKITQNL